MKCPACGRWNKTGQRQERRRLVNDLCDLLGWDDFDRERLYNANNALNQNQLRALISVISIGETGK